VSVSNLSIRSIHLHYTACYFCDSSLLLIFSLNHQPNRIPMAISTEKSKPCHGSISSPFIFLTSIQESASVNNGSLLRPTRPRANDGSLSPSKRYQYTLFHAFPHVTRAVDLSPVVTIPAIVDSFQYGLLDRG
jgi:hypothetical protein